MVYIDSKVIFISSKWAVSLKNPCFKLWLLKDIYKQGTNCIDHKRFDTVDDLDAKYRMYIILLAYAQDNTIHDESILLNHDL